jgi:hypothetical protein
VADIAASTRNENRARLFFDRIEEGFVVGLKFVVDVGIEDVYSFRLVDRQMNAGQLPCPLGRFTRLVKVRSASQLRARPIV